MEQTQPPEDEQTEQTTVAEKDPNPVFTVESPFGQISVDLKQFADAKTAANKMMPKEKRTNFFDSKMFAFLQAPKSQRDSRYWKGHLGALMKMHLDAYLEP
ncbi:MAG: hypothetical protein QNL20_05265, partial [Euryarchaeota archaeon]